MKKYILIFLMLLLPTLSLAVTLEGETYNGYTYEKASLHNQSFSGTLDDTAYMKCAPNENSRYVFKSAHGNNGYVVNEIDVLSEEVERTLSVATTTQTAHKDLVWVDCYNDLMFMMNDAAGGIPNLYSYKLSDFTSISSQALSSTSSDVYGPSFGKLLGNDYNYIGDLSSLKRYDNLGTFTFDIERTVDGAIIDIVTDGIFLYVLTTTTLYKYDEDLFPVEETTTSEIVKTTYPTDRNDYYMYYNSFKDLLFILQDYDTITAFNPDNWVVQFQTNLSHRTYSSLTTGDMADVQWTSKSFYFNTRYYTNGTLISPDIMVACQYETGICEEQFEIGQFSGWNDFYSFNPANTGDSSNRAGVLLDNGKYIFTRSYPYAGIISGFDEVFTFTDTFSISNITINKTPNIINKDIQVTLEGEHFEGDEYLTYGISCNGNNEKIFTHDFNENTDLVNNSLFRNYCDDTSIKVDSFGLNDYALYTDDCILGVYYSVKNKLISGEFSFNMDIGLTNGHELTLHLLGNEAEITEIGTDKTIIEDVIVPLTLIYNSDSQILTITNTHTDEVYLSKHYELSLTPYIYTDRLFISLSILIDLPNNKIKLGVKNYGELGYTYTDETNLTQQQSINIFEEEEVVYHDYILDTNLVISDTDYYFISEETNRLNGSDILDKELNICKYIEKTVGDPIIRDFMLFNTTDGMVAQYGNNFTVTTTSYSWICSDDYNTGKPVYPNNTIHNYEYYGFQCVNCDVTNKIRLGIDTTAINNTSYTSTNESEPYSLYAGDFMIGAFENLNFETLTLSAGYSNFAEYKLIEYDNIENNFHTEITKVDVSNIFLPSLVSNNTKTCSYSSPGIYTVTGYLSSTIDKNYNTFETREIEILATTPNDIGGAFDSAMESDSFSAKFWKFLLFVCFTVMILGGAGLFNSEGGQVKHPQLIMIEFLIFETIMLYFMAKVLSFFPLYYFIGILIIDSMVIVYYIKKVFD